MTNTDSTYVKTSFEKGPVKEIINISGCMLSLAYMEVYVVVFQVVKFQQLGVNFRCGCA